VKWKKWETQGYNGGVSELRCFAGFARLPGGFAARGGSARNRCEDAKAFRMPQARSVKPELEALLRQYCAVHLLRRTSGVQRFTPFTC
tara:strand:+ start:8645 stop:8908 length:264 start_codon:yes stop_codon:yes gene_type:complete